MKSHDSYENDKFVNKRRKGVILQKKHILGVLKRQEAKKLKDINILLNFYFR